MTVLFALEEEFEVVHITEDDMANANSSSASAPDTPSSAKSQRGRGVRSSQRLAALLQRA